MNTICFSVYKNTLKKTDGFNPVSSENKYSEIKLNFGAAMTGKNAVLYRLLSSAD